jgi:hypothetical protein
MKKIFQILIIVCGGLLLNSCYYDEIPEELIIEIPDDPSDPNYVEISFQNDIQTIFNANNCMDCHDANRDPDLREGNAYNSLIPTYVIADNADGSRLYDKLDGGHRDISNEQLELIKAWINQGAKDN